MLIHLSNVGYAQVGFYFLFLNRRLKSASLQAWMQLWAVWEESNRSGRSSAAEISLYATGTHNTPNSITTYEKGQSPPSSLVYEVPPCPTLVDFLSEHAVSAIQGTYSFVLPWSLIHSHWSHKILLLKKKKTKKVLSFSASPSMYDHRRFCDPWTNCSFW